MAEYDALIIGDGIGGLSTAAYLADYGMKVAVFEQHNKPGGLVTSFNLNGADFDCGIEGLHEIGPEGFAGWFLKSWGITLPVVKREENVCVFSRGKSFSVKSGSFIKDIYRCFPHEKNKVDSFLQLNEKIMKQMTEGGPPKPFDEMNILDKAAFGINTAINKPELFKYGLANADSVIRKLYGRNEFADFVFAKALFNIVYLSYAYRWETVRKDCTYYPEGGMQAIADAITGKIKKAGGILKLNTRIERIVIEKNKAKGIIDSNNNYIGAGKIISNAALPYTINNLLGEYSIFNKLKKKVSRKAVFPAMFLSFLGIDRSWDFDGSNYISVIPENCNFTSPEKYSMENCPVTLIKKTDTGPGGRYNSFYILAPLGYNYTNNWNKTNREEYLKLKNLTNETLISKLEEKLGKGFRDAVSFSVPATPLTFERYTGNTEGSFMGFNIRKGEYGKFISQQSPVDNLYFCGQWVYPGFGVAGVMAGGYYCSKRILEKEGINLPEEINKKNEAGETAL